MIISNKNNHLLSKFIDNLLPEDADIKLLFNKDFNGDNQKEVVVGYQSQAQSTFMYPSLVLLYVYRENSSYQYKKFLHTNIDNEPDSIYGVYDGAYAVDTTGDDLPELVLALSMGNGHFVTPYLFSFVDNEISTWYPERDEASYAHGSMYVVDENKDGIYGVVVEYSTYGNEEDITYTSEASAHIRASYIYTWDGMTYTRKPYKIFRPKYKIFNSTAIFLYSIWQEDYQRAFKYAEIPLLIGLDGLDRPLFEVFKEYAKNEIRPVLLKNLVDHKLSYGGGSFLYSSYKGEYNNFYFKLLPGLDFYKITDLRITPADQV